MEAALLLDEPTESLRLCWAYLPETGQSESHLPSYLLGWFRLAAMPRRCSRFVESKAVRWTQWSKGLATDRFNQDQSPWPLLRLVNISDDISPQIELHVVIRSTHSSFQINCHTPGLVSMLGCLSPATPLTASTKIWYLPNFLITNTF